MKMAANGYKAREALTVRKLLKLAVDISIFLFDYKQIQFTGVIYKLF